VTVHVHGSSSTDAALRGSDLNLAVSGVPGLPPPDLATGGGYIPFTRERVAQLLDSLYG